jgi:hypothetical protein
VLKAVAASGDRLWVGRLTADAENLIRYTVEPDRRSIDGIVLAVMANTDHVPRWRLVG